MEISRNSWHYRFVKTFANIKNLEESISTNTCEYLKYLARAVINAFLMVAMGGCFIVFIIYCMVICPIAFMSYSLLCGHTIFQCAKEVPEYFQFGMVALVIYFATTLGLLIWYLVRSTWHHAKELKITNKQGLTSTLYTSWRDKVCVKINIV